jgi:nicotinamidase/pyrazinamidase
MKTLLIIDAQNDFMPGGSLEVENGEAIVPVINRIQNRFDLIVCTQDWHPPNHASFASNHEGKKPMDTIDLGGTEQILWPDHCVQGSNGAKLHSDLETNYVESILRKGVDPMIDSYSGFFDNGHKRSSGLGGYLREKGAEELYFCGLAADVCVYFSIKDALDENFGATLVEDATRALDDKKFDEYKKELRMKGVKFVTSDKIDK